MVRNWKEFNRAINRTKHTKLPTNKSELIKWDPIN